MEADNRIQKQSIRNDRMVIFMHDPCTCVLETNLEKRNRIQDCCICTCRMAYV